MKEPEASLAKIEAKAKAKIEEFDQILNSVLVPIMIDLRNQHREILNKSDLGEEACKTALREYQGKVKPVKTLLSKNYRYKKQALIYKKIKTDVMQIWM